MSKRSVWKVTPKAGSFDRLYLMEEEERALAPGEVRVEVKAIGLNFADIFSIFGLYKATPKGEFIPGLEYSGIITEVGEAVPDHIRRGTRVMAVTRFGGYATSNISDYRYVTPIPENWTFEEGAAYLVQVLTAYYALVELGNLQQNQTVLIHSAAGGVGVWAHRVAKQYNAYTIGCVGSEDKLAVLKNEGFDKGFVRKKDFYNDLQEVLGERPLHLVMECIGGKVLKDSFKAMAKQGRMICYGSAYYAQPGKKPNIPALLLKFLTRPKIDPQLMIQENKAVMGFNLIFLYEQAHKVAEILEALGKMDLGKPYIGHEYHWNDLKGALTEFLSGKTTGKLVVKV